MKKAHRKDEIFKKAVLDHLLDGIISIDERGTILSFNPAAERIFGYRENKVLGKNVRMLMPEPHSREHDGYIKKYLDSGKANIIGIGREVVGKRRDGSVFPMDLGITEAFFDEERLFVGIVRDITEKKEMQAELRHYTAELERSNQTLHDFAFIASHDLQEPLRKIISFSSRVETLYGNILDDRGKDYLRRMQKATLRMKQLLEDLLEYSRVRTEGLPFRYTDINRVVSRALIDLESQVKCTRARITVESLPSIDADELQLCQLFQNLISNALKFRKPGKAPKVTVKSVPCETGWIKISIEDNGIGFDEKYFPRIFKPFERLHGRGEPYDGTGMGLAICQKIVVRHGGEITARSLPQKGSTFVVTLPKKQTASSFSLKES
ncbi:MAG: PAS domain S-box protein [Nitrospinales bacterium]